MLGRSSFIKFLKLGWLTFYVDMKEKDLQYFEHLCDTLYGPSQEQDRRRAENEIAAITKNASFANEIEWGTGGS